MITLHKPEESMIRYSLDGDNNQAIMAFFDLTLDFNPYKL